MCITANTRRFALCSAKDWRCIFLCWQNCPRFVESIITLSQIPPPEREGEREREWRKPQPYAHLVSAQSADCCSAGMWDLPSDFQWVEEHSWESWHRRLRTFNETDWKYHIPIFFPTLMTFKHDRTSVMFSVSRLKNIEHLSGYISDYILATSRPAPIPAFELSDGWAGVCVLL